MVKRFSGLALIIVAASGYYGTMKVSQTYIPTLREDPADAVIASHRLMFRAGLIRKLGNGLFAYLPFGFRSFRKVEQIIREEMDAIGSLEIKPTVVVPGEIWKESGRWDSMGEALLRVKNRLGHDFVVSPTAEEAFTAILRDDISSYRQLPLSLYQINTKYRDEIRPRYGVMRGREFVMKDAYTFDIDEEGLDKNYQAMGRAYRRIFKRCALTVISVKADSGAMGGSGSEEFMVESEIGDNTLLLCKNCDFAANVEKAECKNDFTPCLSLDEAKAAAAATPPIEKVDTPNVKTIEDLCAFLKTSVNSANAKSFIKTLIYRAVNVELENPPLAEAFYAVCIRGDLDVNEAKLAAFLKAAEVGLASEADVERLTGAPIGFAGPVGLKGLPVIVDISVTAISDGITGALARDLHYKHVAYGRDFVSTFGKDGKIAELRTVKAGDLCSHCGGELYEKKGNELGHIFKLGYKYSIPMNIRFLDINGKSQTPIMGSYGIGLDRTLASVIEEHHDEKGIIWPVSVAPYHVIVVPIKYDGAVKTAADKLCADMEALGIEVLLDDRDERPGVKFNDADLTGIPYRLVIGDKNLSGDNPKVEVKRRSEKESRLVDLDKAALEIGEKIKEELIHLRT